MKENADRTPTSASRTFSRPWVFFILVFCWTWAFWIAAAASGTSIQTPPGKLLLFLGLLGPMLGGIALTYLTHDREARREYWLRIIDPRRIPAKWYPVIVFLVPVLMAIAVFIDCASGADETLGQIETRVTPVRSAPWTIVPLALRVFVQGPFPEELGWRGYVLDRLQARWNALTSSLILGSIWALWHLPLFFFKDMLHFTHGVWSLWFWQFMLGIIPMAVILTWIFNNTRRSTLAAILFHFVANLDYELMNVNAQTNFYSTLLWIIAATGVVVIWGARGLTRR